jgi:hypothetical protein
MGVPLMRILFFLALVLETGCSWVGRTEIEGQFALREGGKGDSAWRLEGESVRGPDSEAIPKMRTTAGSLSCCSVGSSRLMVRAEDVDRRLENPAGVIREPPAEIRRCLEKAEQTAQNGKQRLESRKKTGECLTNLLAGPDLALQDEAAESLARGKFWSGRFVLTKILLHWVDSTDKSVEGGRHFVRLAKAHAQLRKWIPDEVFDALSRSPDVNVRRELVAELLPHFPKKLLDAGWLLQDPDTWVRIGSIELGCRMEDRQSEKAFMQEMKNPKAEVRAAAVLYARSCVPLTHRFVIEAAQREEDDLVALLMLQALAEAPKDLVLDRAQRLQHSMCSGASLLAGRLMSRVSGIQETQGEEPSNGSWPDHQVIQVWMQMDSEKP